MNDSYFLRNSHAFWIDRNFNEFESEEVDNDYLKHIIYFLAEGNGWELFLTENKIYDIFKEAYRRKLCRADVLLTLHLWSLYYHGFTDYEPIYKVTWEGNYFKNIDLK